MLAIIFSHYTSQQTHIEIRGFRRAPFRASARRLFVHSRYKSIFILFEGKLQLILESPPRLQVRRVLKIEPLCTGDGPSLQRGAEEFKARKRLRLHLDIYRHQILTITEA
jgi:hypothetical protein